MGKEHGRSFWGAGNVRLLDLDSGYMIVFNLWKFIKLSTNNMYIFEYI